MGLTILVPGQLTRSSGEIDLTFNQIFDTAACVTGLHINAHLGMQVHKGQRPSPYHFVHGVGALYSETLTPASILSPGASRQQNHSSS
jgi:hypothetical protein